MSYLNELPDPPSFLIQSRTSHERELIRQCWSHWRSLDLPNSRPRSIRDQRLRRILEAPKTAETNNDEERLLREIIQSLARADVNSIATETPQSDHTEPSERWYPRSRCKIGIHYPNPRDRVYFERRRHR